MVNAGFIISSALGFITTVIVIAQAIRNPKKLRYFIVCYAVCTLPASIVNTLAAENVLRDRWNTLCYLLSTVLMLTLNYYMTLDIGFRMQVRQSWLRYLAYISIFFLVTVFVFLIVQIVILLIHEERDYSIWWMFVLGVCLAIAGQFAAYSYAFMPLIRWKKNKRTQEAHSRTTAYGIWFLSIQSLWYSLYGVLYFWFFGVNTWDQFTNMLAVDYPMRFLLCLIFTFSPPSWIIDCMSSHLSSHNQANLNTTPGTLSQNIPDTYMPTLLNDERYNVFGEDEEAKTSSRIAMITTASTPKPEPSYSPSS